MRSLAVVVIDVGPKHLIEMPTTQDEQPVQALSPHRFNPALRVRVRRPDGGEDHVRSSRAEDLVEGAAKFGVTIVDKEPHRWRAILEVHREVPRLLGHPGRVRVGRGGAQMDSPALEFDEDKDVERPEPHRLDGEKVAGDDPCGLGSQELGPRGARASWGRTAARSSEERPDRCGTDCDPELAELALDPHAPPTGILPGKAQDERPNLRVDRRPARLRPRSVGPAPSHELPVPAQERLWGDDERRPPVSREEPARRGEEHPVQGSELRSEGLAAQDAYLMAKDQDFQGLGTLVRAPAYEQARECLHDEGQEEEHRSMVARGPLVQAPTGISDPHGLPSTPGTRKCPTRWWSLRSPRRSAVSPPRLRGATASTSLATKSSARRISFAFFSPSRRVRSITDGLLAPSRGARSLTA